MGCSKKTPPSSNSNAGPPSTTAATPSASPVASAGDKGLKGSAGGSDGEPSSGALVAGEVVIKSHDLPPANRPVAEFTPAASGFKFQNYGNDKGYTNLTITEVRRMFGDQVCASTEGGNCVLTPVAAQWIEGSNKSMGGGHCEGFAALALLMERGQIDPKLFGADGAGKLDVDGNEKLQREIAYWFVTQGVPPMSTAEDKSLTPAQVEEKLAASFKGDLKAETFTLGLYAPGYKMGHATTPYAVIEKPDDVAWIMHYDNNYPGEEKSVVVDKKTNKWTYTTAADPAAGEHAYEEMLPPRH